MTNKFCGLCQVEIFSWEEHIKSELHIRNLVDREAVVKSVEKHKNQMKSSVDINSRESFKYGDDWNILERKSEDIKTIIIKDKEN